MTNKFLRIKGKKQSKMNIELYEPGRCSFWPGAIAPDSVMTRSVKRFVVKRDLSPRQA
jgi:hypothetical protein